MAVLNIVITKAKQTIQVNTDGPDEGGDLPAEIYEAALAEGLKVLLNKGMSKITVKDLEGAKLTDAQEAAMEVAQKNLVNLREGKLKARAASAKSDGKTPAVVMNEARRLAKVLIKDTLKAAGKKPAEYTGAEITAFANILLETNPSLLETAKANIEARKAKLEEVKSAIDVTQMKADPKRIAAVKAKADKAKVAKGQVSAKQAGIITKHKPAAGAHATH